MEESHSNKCLEYETKIAALIEESCNKESTLRTALQESQQNTTTAQAEFDEFKRKVEEADQRAKLEMVKMQADTRKLYQVCDRKIYILLPISFFIFYFDTENCNTCNGFFFFV